MDVNDIDRLGWENSTNFDKLIIILTTFSIGYLHQSDNLFKSCYVKLFAFLIVLSSILSISNYLLAQKVLRPQKKYVKTCLYKLSVYLWFSSGFIFLFGFGGLMFCIIFMDK